MKLKPCWLFHNCNWIIFCKLKSYLTVKYIVLCVNTTWWRKIKNEPILYLVAKRKIISHFPLSYLQLKHSRVKCIRNNSTTAGKHCVYTWIFFVFLHSIYRKKKIISGLCHCEFFKITSIILAIYMLYIVWKFSTSPLVLFIFW